MTADLTGTNTDSEGEEPESVEEIAHIQKEMQELGQRAWGSRLKSFQLRASRLETPRGGAAPDYNTDQSSIDKGMEAPGKKKQVGEGTPRIKDHKAEKRDRQKVHALHNLRRPRPDNPN